MFRHTYPEIFCNKFFYHFQLQFTMEEKRALQEKEGSVGAVGKLYVTCRLFDAVRHAHWQHAIELLTLYKCCCANLVYDGSTLLHALSSVVDKQSNATHSILTEPIAHQLIHTLVINGAD